MCGVCFGLVDACKHTIALSHLTQQVLWQKDVFVSQFPAFNLCAATSFPVGLHFRLHFLASTEKALD